MTAQVSRITEAQARRRRQAIVDEVGDENVLRDRGRTYQLDSRERALLDELEDLDYLLAL
jgi:hypothetical protein